MTDQLWLRFCIVVLRCLAKLIIDVDTLRIGEPLSAVMANKLADELLERKGTDDGKA